MVRILGGLLMVKVMVCGRFPELAASTAALLSQSSSIELAPVLTELDEVLSKIDKGDFDVCVVGIHSYTWFDALSAHIQNVGRKTDFVWCRALTLNRYFWHCGAGRMRFSIWGCLVMYWRNFCTASLLGESISHAIVY